MRKATKKEKRIYDAAEWRRALSEGRVVRFNDGMSLQSHPTVAGAEARLAELLAGGDASAEIVKVKEVA